MDLKTYVSNIESSASLARSIGVTPGFISQWLSGLRQVPAERCIEIERATHGKVRCEDLRPDVDWAVLRGSDNKEAA